jgi:hypothetical protein
MIKINYILFKREGKGVTSAKNSFLLANFHRKEIQPAFVSLLLHHVIFPMDYNV